jgi:hypothetical protein
VLTAKEVRYEWAGCAEPVCDAYTDLLRQEQNPVHTAGQVQQAADLVCHKALFVSDRESLLLNTCIVHSARLVC